MSESGGGAGAGVFIGAAVGGAAMAVIMIAVFIYCYLKARKEKLSNTNMTKSNDIFTTGKIYYIYIFSWAFMYLQEYFIILSRTRWGESGRF